MSCSTSTAPPPPRRDTGAARAMNVRPGSRGERQLACADLLAAQRRVSCAAMSGWRMTSRYGRPVADGVDAQHLLRGAVDQLQPSLPIDHEHAFDHAA